MVFRSVLTSKVNFSNFPARVALVLLEGYHVDTCGFPRCFLASHQFDDRISVSSVVSS